MFAAPQGVVLDALTLVQSALGQQQQQQLQQLQEKRVGKQLQPQEQAAAAAGSAGGAVGDAADGQLAKKLSTSMRLEISEQVRGRLHLTCMRFVAAQGLMYIYACRH